MPEFKSREEYEKWTAEKMASSNQKEGKPDEQSQIEESRASAKGGLNFCPHCGRSLDNATGRERPDIKLEAVLKEEDFIAFVGNNAPGYLEKFKKFSIGGVDNFTATWHWPAFLAGFWWMLYRKLYLWALISFIGMFIPYVNFAAWIAFGVVSNYIYYKDAKKKILALRALHPQGDISVTLAQVGGINRWVPVVAVIITLIALILAIIGGLMSALMMRHRYI